MPKPYRLLLASAAVTALALTGCSNLNQTVPKSSVAEPTKVSPTPSPTPTIWTTQEAATQYLQAVCPVNRLVTPVNTAMQNGDFAALHTLSPQLVEADTNAAKKLDAGQWPAEVKDDIATVRDAYFATITVDQQAGAAQTMDQLNAVVWPDTSAASTASQRLRSRLGLPADQMAGC
jgi:alkyl sulfatase BDS1-like metallo-beta-lactamase superfamily hydrolase